VFYTSVFGVLISRIVFYGIFWLYRAPHGKAHGRPPPVCPTVE